MGYDTRMQMPTAAVLLIGNELLSGKVQDANLLVIARELRGLGVHLRRVNTIEDELETITAEVRSLAASHDWVVTSGGIGPTHDDVTLPAVAAAFGRTMVRSPELEGLLRDYYGARLLPTHLRMADVPDGTELVLADREPSGGQPHPWPTILVRNVFVLPGVPQVFQMKMAAVRARLSRLGAKPFVSHAVMVDLDEGQIKEALDDVVAKYPDVSIGSYPTWIGAPYKTKLTFDGTEAARVMAAREAFAGAIPVQHIRGRE